MPVPGHQGNERVRARQSFRARSKRRRPGPRWGAGPFDPEPARRVATTPSVPGATWRLGWDTPSPTPGVSHAGDRWPRDGFGHLAFTGCSMWLDPPRDRAVVILTNRVHPTREGSGIRDLRRAVMDAVTGALDASG